VISFKLDNFFSLNLYYYLFKESR